MLRRIAFVLLFALLALLAMLFTSLNRARFSIDVAFLEFEVSSGIALVVTFSAGLLAGAFARARWVRQLLAERGRLRQALRLAEGRLGAASTAVTHDDDSLAEATPPPVDAH